VILVALTTLANFNFGRAIPFRAVPPELLSAVPRRDPVSDDA
jgi:hypothetical protein